MSRFPFPVALAAVLTVSGGCATSPSRSDAAHAFRVVLVVENGHFDPVTVFVRRAGTLIRLGSVPGVSQRRFQLDAAVAGPSPMVQLLAENRSPSSPSVVAEVPLEPGLEARWILAQGLRHGMVLIR